MTGAGSVAAAPASQLDTADGLMRSTGLIRVLRACPRRRGDRPEPAPGRRAGPGSRRRRSRPQGRRGVRSHLRPDDRRRVQYYLGEGLSAGRKAIRGWLDDLSDRLVTVDVDGEDRLVLADDVDDLTSTDGLAHRSPAAGRRSVGDGAGHRRPPRRASCPSAARHPRRQPRARRRRRGRRPGRARRRPSPSPGSARTTPDRDLLEAEAARPRSSAPSSTWTSRPASRCIHPRRGRARGPAPTEPCADLRGQSLRAPE